MSLNEQIKEIEEVVGRLLDNISHSICSQTCSNSVELRPQVGYVHANIAALLVEGEFADELLKCFTYMYEAKASLDALSRIHTQLFAEDPSSEVASAIVQGAICFCLSVEARLVSVIEFKSRDDVDVMMTKMRKAFDTAKEKAADDHNSNAYQELTKLAGALSQHLATTARPLPRIVNFTLGKPFPALKTAQRVYYDASRWEEIVDENKIVNPLFVPREFRGLSN